MNPVIESLLEIVDTDPLPAVHTSSHWQRYGRETIVERQNNGLVLLGFGFGVVRARGFRRYILRVITGAERVSYQQVAARLKNYRSVWRTATNLASDLSFDMTFDVWKQAIALAVLEDHWAEHDLLPRTFALIGDGYGFLGTLIRRRFPKSRLYCIDLPKMLVFQAHTHELADPAGKMSLLRRSESEGAAVVFALPQDIEIISDQIDCAVNIASMQEMKESSIVSYFHFLRRRSTRRSRFYCVNRLRKELPGGEVCVFADYPWREDDEIFIDGPCPYYTHFFAPYTLPNGPRWFGCRVPFINYFDGIHMHRLIHLESVA